MNPFRRDAPNPTEIAAFDRDGYIAFPDAMHDAYRDALVEEVVSAEEVNAFLSRVEASPDDPETPRRYFVRPWNDRGPLSDALIDAPLVTSLLRSTVGPDVHFCHSSMNLAMRGAEAIRFHQDHHHWNHDNPVNLAERERLYIQILYYPNGFTRGDRSLVVLPGSHRVSPTEDVTPERLLSGAFDAQAGCELRPISLELPPGSFVYLNARMFHGVDPKPPDSPQSYRIFLIDIFKEAGPPHRYTQEIPGDWMRKATPSRRKLFDREPWTETCWEKA